jgi:hypothetical protein
MNVSLRRRSERLLITIPIRVEGKDRNGHPFADTTRTLAVNRHGARIQLARFLNSGETVRVTNLVANQRAEFRVVGPTQPPTQKGGEWGVECLEESRNVWGIEFPPANGGEQACSVLLECRRCHEVQLSRLSLVEVDVLQASGLLTRECGGCGKSTPWGHVEKQVGMPAPGPEMDRVFREILQLDQAEGSRRAAPRSLMRLPLRVRSWYGNEELTRSENVSRVGLAFTSEKVYEVGEALMVTCPYDPSGQNPEMRGRVARRFENSGPARHLYGVRYEREA